MKKIIFCSTLALTCLIAGSCSSASSKTTANEQEKPAPVEAPITPTPTPAPVLKDKGASCVCIKMWMPVCGENNKTYGNACEAQCAGVKYKAGACGEMK